MILQKSFVINPVETTQEKKNVINNNNCQQRKKVFNILSFRCHCHSFVCLFVCFFSIDFLNQFFQWNQYVTTTTTTTTTDHHNSSLSPSPLSYYHHQHHVNSLHIKLFFWLFNFDCKQFFIILFIYHCSVSGGCLCVVNVLCVFVWMSCPINLIRQIIIMVFFWFLSLSACVCYVWWLVFLSSTANDDDHKIFFSSQNKSTKIIIKT